MRLVPVLFLAGCLSNPAVTDQAPPPGALTIQLPFFTAGSDATIDLLGAQSFEEIEIVFGTRGLGAGPCPAAYGGSCLDVVRGQTLTSVFAGVGGEASYAVTPPASVAGVEVCMQAVVVRGPGGANTEISSPVCRTIEAVCGPSAWEVDFSGFTPGVYDVLRLPNVTITASPRSIVVNPDASISIDGGVDSTLIDPDERLTFLFDRDVHGLEVNLEDIIPGGVRLTPRIYGEHGAPIASYGTGGSVGWHDTSIAIEGGEPLSAATMASGSDSFGVFGLRGTVDGCPCTDKTRKISFYIPGDATMDALIYPGMSVISPQGIEIGSGFGTGPSGSTSLGDSYTMAFAPPADAVDLNINVGGATADIQAWDAAGTPLSTVSVSLPDRVMVNDLVGGVSISALRLTGVSGNLRTASITRDQCR